MTGLVVRSAVHGGGVIKQERVSATCPACGQQVEAVAMNGRVKGYCAVARHYVDFLVRTTTISQRKHLTGEANTEMPAALTPGRDSRGVSLRAMCPGIKKCRGPI
jgi:hypothetical protein